MEKLDGNENISLSIDSKTNWKSKLALLAICYSNVRFTLIISAHKVLISMGRVPVYTTCSGT